LQYLDYVDWERRHLSEEKLATQLAFWQKHLAGAAPAVAWPDSARPQPDLAPGGAALSASLSPDLCDAVRARAKQIESTVFTLLLASFALTLRRITGQDDLVVGTVTASRELPELTEMIGCFINFLPLRLRPSELHSELLADTKRVLRDALGHQSCPFDRIVASVHRRSRDPGSPLYNVALLWQGFEGWSARRELVLGPELVARLEPMSTDAPLLDLRLVAEPDGDGIRIGCEYRSDRLSGAFVAKVLAAFDETLRELALSEARPWPLETLPDADDDQSFLTMLSEMSDEQASLLVSEQNRRMDRPHD
jgi:non-ribosomal peptide synthetase component F